MARWRTRDDVLEQLQDSDGEVSSGDYSVYQGEGIVRYLPRAASVVLDHGERSGAGAMDLVLKAKKTNPATPTGPAAAISPRAGTRRHQVDSPVPSPRSRKV